MSELIRAALRNYMEEREWLCGPSGTRGSALAMPNRKIQEGQNEDVGQYWSTQ